MLERQMLIGNRKQIPRSASAVRPREENGPNEMGKNHKPLQAPFCSNHPNPRTSAHHGMAGRSPAPELRNC